MNDTDPSPRAAEAAPAPVVADGVAATFPASPQPARPRGSAALTILATLAVLYTLYAARELLLPLGVAVRAVLSRCRRPFSRST